MEIRHPHTSHAHHNVSLQVSPPSLSHINIKTDTQISSIDKSNLGNAKTDNMTTDLHFNGNQYNTLLSIFYVPLVLTALPMNMLTKKFGAKYVLPIAMIIFGSMAMISAGTTNFGGIVTTRWFWGWRRAVFILVLSFI
jgi:hypothetical protein